MVKRISEISAAAAICATLGIISIALCLYCLIQVPVIKIKTTDALKESKILIDYASLSEKNKKELDFYVGHISYNDRAFLATHKNIWPASTIGFLFLGLSNLFLARRLNRKTDPI